MADIKTIEKIFIGKPSEIYHLRFMSKKYCDGVATKHEHLCLAANFVVRDFCAVRISVEPLDRLHFVDGDYPDLPELFTI